MKTSFMSACKNFFGLKHGQKTPLQFGQEVKALTPEDRADMKHGLKAALKIEIE